METLLAKIGAGLVGIAISVSGWLGYAPNTGATVQPIGGQTYTLAGSGVTGSASSITLQSFTIPQTGQKIQDSDVSSTFFLTIEPGNRTRQEFASCTTVTQNSNGTATLSGCSRGLSPITPYTASSTLQFAHAGGTQVVFSDPPQVFNQYAAKDNDELIPGQWTASGTSPWIYDADFTVGSTTRAFAPVNWIVDNFLDPGTTTARTLGGLYTITQGFTNSATSTFSQGALLGYSIDSGADDLAVANKSYVDGVAVAGASDANTTTKGIVEEATAGEINSSASTGGTGAKLFMTPSTFASSNYSNDTAIVATSSSASYLATESISMDVNDVLMIWGKINIANCSTPPVMTLRIKASNYAASSTIDTSTQDTSGEGCTIVTMGVYQASTTVDVIIDATSGSGVMTLMGDIKRIP